MCPRAHTEPLGGDQEIYGSQEWKESSVGSLRTPEQTKQGFQWLNMPKTTDFTDFIQKVY